MQSVRTLVVLGICACGSPHKPAPVPVPAPAPAPVPAPVPVAAAADAPPEYFAPAYKQVGVGQTISLSTSTIDQDLEDTRSEAVKLPKSAKFDAITQTITWTPTKDDQPKASFSIAITQAGKPKLVRDFTIDVVDKPVPPPAPAAQAPIVETLLLIHDPRRLEAVNAAWPLDKLLEVGAATFVLQFPPDKRATLKTKLDGKTAYTQMLAGLAQTHGNPRLDPASPQFDRAAFGDPKSWKIVAFRPRIDKAWTELRVVYQAINAPEPVFAMFRLRPVVEYVPALPRPDEERDANNRLFLSMVVHRLMKDGGPNPAFVKDVAAHGKAVAALMTDVMTFDESAKLPYLHGFMIGIALEARMGGGSARNADGTYKSGDGWAWSAQKPFRTADGTAQAYVNVAIPGFWTKTVPSDDGTTWVPKCAPRFDEKDPQHAPGFEILCRKTMGFVDLPAVEDGKPIQGKIDANNLYREHKLKFSVENFPLTDGRRDLGEENGMTCAQCHIRNFGMHDYADPAATDPSKGVPKAPNHAIATLNFQIIPTSGQGMFASDWQAFTLEFVQHQECRGKLLLEQYFGAAVGKGLTCPLSK